MTETTPTSALAKRPRKMAREAKPENAQSKVLAHQGAALAELSEATAAPLASSASKAASKSSLVLEMLTQPEGATIDQLVAATGWLPHTTRAALTGLKKKGHSLSSNKIEGTARVYRVSNAAQPMASA